LVIIVQNKHGRFVMGKIPIRGDRDRPVFSPQKGFGGKQIVGAKIGLRGGVTSKVGSRLKGKLVGKAASVGYESHASCGDW